MVRYWLTPVTLGETVDLSAERIPLDASDAEALRAQAAKGHPRLLPSFKAALLVEGADGACGPGDAELDLARPSDVALVGAFALSHCGEAFLDRLLSPEEALAAAATLPDDAALERARDWWRRGYRVMMLKEE